MRKKPIASAVMRQLTIRRAEIRRGHRGGYVVVQVVGSNVWIIVPPGIYHGIPLGNNVKPDAVCQWLTGRICDVRVGVFESVADDPSITVTRWTYTVARLLGVIPTLGGPPYEMDGEYDAQSLSR